MNRSMKIIERRRLDTWRRLSSIQSQKCELMAGIEETK